MHPRCEKGRPIDEPLWYSGVPLLLVSLPVADSARLPGSGHFLKPEELLQSYRSGTYKPVQPPSDLLLSEMKRLKYKMPDDYGICELSKKVLLSPEETRM